MTANDKPDNITVPAEALPDGALAQVTGGGITVEDWIVQEYEVTL